MDRAREAAVFALERFRRGGAWSGAMSDTLKTKYGLDERSLSLAVNISLGVLQNMSLCDYYINLYSRTKSIIEPKVRDILRVGVYQLLFMSRIPSHAAVNEAVDLCRRLRLSRASGFVNAVLHRVAENRCCLPEIPDKGTARYLSVKYSHPLWLCEYMIGLRGYEGAEGFLAANNTPPETDLQVNTLKISNEELLNTLKSNGADCKAHPWLPDCIVLGGGGIASLAGFNEGLFYVQDAAAKCAVLCSGIERGMSVLDACAAPGGKSFATAVAMKNDGRIVSCDIHEKKLRLIAEGAKRLGITCISTRAHDARQPFENQYDLALADVPCSGLGVIRKKPEIRYKKQDDIAALPELQLNILQNLKSAVKVGGALVYSTCTVLREENEGVVDAFLAQNPDFCVESFTLPNETETSGYATLWPDLNGTDGFFIAKLRRSK